MTDVRGFEDLTYMRPSLVLLFMVLTFLRCLLCCLSFLSCGEYRCGEQTLSQGISKSVHSRAR
jgi:hypothetical protein